MRRVPRTFPPSRVRATANVPSSRGLGSSAEWGSACGAGGLDGRGSVIAFRVTPRGGPVNVR